MDAVNASKEMRTIMIRCGGCSKILYQESPHKEAKKVALKQGKDFAVRNRMVNTNTSRRSGHDIKMQAIKAVIEDRDPNGLTIADDILLMNQLTDKERKIIREMMRQLRRGKR